VLLRFLQTLQNPGRAELTPTGRDWVAVIKEAEQDETERRRSTRLLESWHAEAVLDLPGPPLPFHLPAAWWGAVMLFRAACIVAFREIGESEVIGLLQREPMPEPAEPAAHFSADLCLRHWPDLYRMARARSEDDPLVGVMHDLTRSFPLSAPGMHQAVAPPEHSGLRLLFAERALERADTTCLAQPEVAALVRSKLGAYAQEMGRGLLSPATDS
jgi:hypothetical protein